LSYRIYENGAVVGKDKLKDLVESNSHLRVLYVEDNQVVRESTIYILEEFFSHIDVAIDGQDGLEKYQKHLDEQGQEYDIVITDISMPRMSGIVMSEHIFEINRDQIILVISAHNESDYLLKLINLGITNFTVKPIKVPQLQQIIVKILDTISSKKVIKEQYDKIERMNSVLKEAKGAAELASKLKSEFLANMSHEIRTPLNAITGFISLLHSEEDDPKKLEHLEIIQKSSESLLQIISDILDISKIESGKLELLPTDFSPYDDLIKISELFQARASERSIILDIKHNLDVNKVLYSDVLRIRQILVNLLSNAIKFSSRHSTIKCIMWHHKNQLNIRVKDYGIGIPEDKQAHIFESYTQAESSTVREYGGTGLGLAISMKLTELLGGSLSLDSTVGKGSIFTLSIPVRLGRSVHRTKYLKKDAKPIEGKKILLVDDIETNRMFISIVLKNLKLDYEEAVNGEEAVEKFISGKFDLILMDENMPKLSGTGATKAILEIERRESMRHTPIISLTANALKGDREKFINAGMDDYLSKPVNPKLLTDMLHKYLG